MAMNGKGTVPANHQTGAARPKKRGLQASRAPSCRWCLAEPSCEAKAAFDEAQKELDVADEVACEKEAGRALKGWVVSWQKWPGFWFSFVSTSTWRVRRKSHSPPEGGPCQSQDTGGSHRASFAGGLIS